MRHMTEAERLEACRMLLDQAAVSAAQSEQRQLDKASKRLQRGQPVDRLLGSIERRLQASIKQVAARAQSELLTEYPADLPVCGRRDDILQALAEHQVIVLTGETGSGKTTQLPKLLWESGRGRRGLIGMTQPRRVAAMSVARRIAEEMQAQDEQIVHSVRFDDKATDDTLIRIMTDGLLLAEAGRDRELSRYDCLVIDEAHERSLNIDVLLGLLRGLVDRRSDLQLIITSASIDAEAFANFFSRPDRQVPVLAVSGRGYPVDIAYREPADDDVGYLPTMIQCLEELHQTESDGDVLAFLPTERDILEARRRLDKLSGATILPLFARLNPHEQQAVFAPCRGRKIVLATNIAETSLTVPGIRFVVDAGLARIKRYAGGSRTERLPIEAISQASATQRAGRAGRLGPGICLRLYPEDDFANRPAYTEPEIRRSNLAGVLLLCLSSRLGDPEHFPWLDAPSSAAWTQARGLLLELGAIERTPRVRGEVDSYWRLTTTGRRLARLSCDPQLGAMLLAGIGSGVVHEACTIAAFLTIQDPRLRPTEQAAEADRVQAEFLHEAGDIMTIMQLWQAYKSCGSTGAQRRFATKHLLSFRRLREWADVRRQLWTQLREQRDLGTLPAQGHELDRLPIDALHKAVLAGSLGNVALYDEKERSYRCPGNRRAVIHPGSALRRNKDGAQRKTQPTWLMSCEVVETSRLFLRVCCPVDPKWIIELAGDRIKRSRGEPFFDDKRLRISCVERLGWKGLPVQEARSVAYERIDAERAGQLFIEHGLVHDGLPVRLDFQKHNKRIQRQLASLVDRLRDGSIHVDEQAITDFYTQQFAKQGAAVPASMKALQHWCRQFGDASLHLQPEQLIDPILWQRAKTEAPSHLRVAGRKIRLHYRFAPGSDDDGVTIKLAEKDLAILPQLDLDRAIPGLRRERVGALLKSLPKDQRRQLIPLQQSMDEAFAALGDGRVEDELREWLRHKLGVPLSALVFGSLPAHVLPRLLVEADDGSIRYSGRDPTVALGLAGVAVADLGQQAYQTEPARSWPGDLPEQVDIAGQQAYPVIMRCRAADAGVAIQRSACLHRKAAALWHADGLLAFLEIGLDSELTTWASRVDADTDKRCRDVLGIGRGALYRQMGLALAAQHIELQCRTETVAEQLLQAAQAALATKRTEIEAAIDATIIETRLLDKALRRGVSGFAAAAVARSVQEDRQRLIGDGWWQRLPFAGLLRIPVYLEACTKRLEAAAKAKANPQRDRMLAAVKQLRERQVPRLIHAMGLRPDWQEAQLALEECLVAGTDAAWAKQQGQPAVAAVEGTVVEICWRIERAVDKLEQSHKQLRHQLLDKRPFVQRMPDSPSRDALLKRMDGLLRDFPDLSLGCDLEAQAAAAQELLQETAGFLA